MKQPKGLTMFDANLYSKVYTEVVDTMIEEGIVDPIRDAELSLRERIQTMFNDRTTGSKLPQQE